MAPVPMATAASSRQRSCKQNESPALRVNCAFFSHERHTLRPCCARTPFQCSLIKWVTPCPQSRALTAMSTWPVALGYTEQCILPANTASVPYDSHTKQRLLHAWVATSTKSNEFHTRIQEFAFTCFGHRWQSARGFANTAHRLTYILNIGCHTGAFTKCKKSKLKY
jgi:hypothetical protein